MIAVTDINHGNPDGSVTYINAGDEVEGLPEEVVDELLASGAISDQPSPAAATDRIKELEAEVARLQALANDRGTVEGSTSPLQPKDDDAVESGELDTNAAPADDQTGGGDPEPVNDEFTDLSRAELEEKAIEAGYTQEQLQSEDVTDDHIRQALRAKRDA
jgi:hypothetical protein